MLMNIFYPRESMLPTLSAKKLAKKNQIARTITHTRCIQNTEGRTKMFHQCKRNKKTVKFFNNEKSSLHYNSAMQFYIPNVFFQSLPIDGTMAHS